MWLNKQIKNINNVTNNMDKPTECGNLARKYNVPMEGNAAQIGCPGIIAPLHETPAIELSWGYVTNNNDKTDRFNQFYSALKIVDKFHDNSNIDIKPDYLGLDIRGRIMLKNIAEKNNMPELIIKVAPYAKENLNLNEVPYGKGTYDVSTIYNWYLLYPMMTYQCQDLAEKYNIAIVNGREADAGCPDSMDPINKQSTVKFVWDFTAADWVSTNRYCQLELALKIIDKYNINKNSNIENDYKALDIFGRVMLFNIAEKNNMQNLLKTIAPYATDGLKLNEAVTHSQNTKTAGEIYSRYLEEKVTNYIIEISEAQFTEQHEKDPSLHATEKTDSITKPQTQTHTYTETHSYTHTTSNNNNNNNTISFLDLTGEMNDLPEGN